MWKSCFGSWRFIPALKLLNWEAREDNWEFIAFNISWRDESGVEVEEVEDFEGVGSSNSESSNLSETLVFEDFFLWGIFKAPAQIVQSLSLPITHLSFPFLSFLHFKQAWWLSQGNISPAQMEHFLCFSDMVKNLWRSEKNACVLDGGQNKNDNLQWRYNLQQVPAGVYVCTFSKKNGETHCLCPWPNGRSRKLMLGLCKYVFMQ